MTTFVKLPNGDVEIEHIKEVYKNLKNMESQNTFELEKFIWTESDFEDMSWHDCKIHAMSFNANYELSMDIDYIAQWVLKGKKYKFWISPATIVFENVYELELENSSMDLIIDFIERQEKGKPINAKYIGRDMEYEWTVQLISGWLSFRSVGFKQYIRKRPKLQSVDHLPVEGRGGISFERTIGE